MLQRELVQMGKLRYDNVDNGRLAGLRKPTSLQDPWRPSGQIRNIICDFHKVRAAASLSQAQSWPWGSQINNKKEKYLAYSNNKEKLL